MKKNWVEDESLVERFSIPIHTLGEWCNNGTPENFKTKENLKKTLGKFYEDRRN